MTPIVGNRGQVWTSTLSPHLLSPHLDFPNLRGVQRDSRATLRKRKAENATQCSATRAARHKRCSVWAAKLTTLGCPRTPDPRNSSVEKIPEPRGPSVEGSLGWAQSLSLGIPRFRNSSAQEILFLGSGVLGHPRVVSIQGWFWASPKNSPNPKTIKVTKLQSHVSGSSQSNPESYSKVTKGTQKRLKNDRKVNFESLSGLLWGDPQKSVLSSVTLIVLGFGGKRNFSPKRKFLWRISRGHPGVIRADIPAQNFGQVLEQKRAFRRGHPWPERPRP